MAQVTIGLLDSKPRVAEKIFGWGGFKGSFVKRMEQGNTACGKNYIGYFELSRLRAQVCCKNQG
jgi:hypothetical protein